MPHAEDLRHLLGFLGSVGIQRKRGEIRDPPDPWPIAQGLRDFARCPDGSQTLLQAPPPSRGFATFTRIFWACRNYAKAAPTRRGDAIRDPRFRGRLRRIFRRSRDFKVALRNFPMAHARWFCAVYWDFPRPVGIRRKRDLLGAGQGCRIRGFFGIFQDFARRAVRALAILNNVRPPELGILNNVHSGGALRGPE